MRKLSTADVSNAPYARIHIQQPGFDMMRRFRNPAIAGA
jgi:hypothetical protein